MPGVGPSSFLGTPVAPTNTPCPWGGLGSQYHLVTFLGGPAQSAGGAADDCQNAAAWVLSAVRRGIPGLSVPSLADCPAEQ